MIGRRITTTMSHKRFHIHGNECTVHKACFVDFGAFVATARLLKYPSAQNSYASQTSVLRLVASLGAEVGISEFFIALLGTVRLNRKELSRGKVLNEQRRYQGVRGCWLAWLGE